MKDRRNKENLHTLLQLEKAGNKMINMSMSRGVLLMSKGKTITQYFLHDEHYWKPMNSSVR